MILLDDGNFAHDILSPKKHVSKEYYVEIDKYLIEGRYHQIKRMFGCFGAEVLELKRIRMGNFKLPEGLEVGDVRELTEEELSLIKEK